MQELVGTPSAADDDRRLSASNAGDAGANLLLVGELVIVLLVDGDILYVWRGRHT